jgi:hypothetical protein
MLSNLLALGYHYDALLKITMLSNLLALGYHYDALLKTM